MRRAIGRQRGSASVELVIVLIPFLTLFLGLVQLSLLAVARLTVEHAAFSAARAAVVAAPRSKEGPQAADDTTVSDLQGTVRKAAVFPLIGVSPIEQRGLISVSTAVGGGNPNAGFAPRAAYAQKNTTVTVTPSSPGWNAQVTAEVKYRFACQVPLAKQVICRAGPSGHFLEMTASHTLTNQGKP